MAPLGLIVTAALLALSGVEASKDKLAVYQFVDPKCDGRPVGEQLELKRDECKAIDAAGVRLQLPEKSKNAKWISEINNGNLLCVVTLYDQAGCPIDSSETGSGNAAPYQRKSHNYPVPGDFAKCLPVPSRAARSIKFRCGPNTSFGEPVIITKTAVLSSYFFGPGGTPIPSPYTTNVTLTSWSYPAQTLEPRAGPSADSRLSARGKHNNKGVWMKHPWSDGNECFECWTKKEYITSDFKCEAGPDTNIDCGVVPSRDLSHLQHVLVTALVTETVYLGPFTTVTGNVDVVPTTIVETITEVGSIATLVPTTYVETNTKVDSIAKLVPTTNVKINAKVGFATTTHFPTQAASLEERSEKKTVLFRNPFAPEHVVCAKAKWHDSDSYKQRVDIKGPKDCDSDPNENQSIDIPYPTTTIVVATRTTTSTVTMPPSTYTVLPASTSTVFVTSTLGWPPSPSGVTTLTLPPNPSTVTSTITHVPAPTITVYTTVTSHSP